MPPTQRGQAYRLAWHRWGPAIHDADGVRQHQGPFATKSAALWSYHDVIERQLRGEALVAPGLTLGLVELYLERQACGWRSRTIVTLHERLAHATRALGDVPLRNLERRSRNRDLIRHGWLSEGTRDGLPKRCVRRCTRRALGHMTRNPASSR
jgi:hypothetical protein